ncbi:uncharacterized protein LOC119078003 [Bradysia coprophila]|uniref:uncharacterized protein LOC119078003 n=1 Tax=Bradysia coprophila TaxID=38358 RepID=UPI00187DA75C|nr:uncharacterized protein LOC119078003 [Bradysia coprophila]
MFLFTNEVCRYTRTCKPFNFSNLICGLCVLALLSPVACVNPSPTGIYRYEETTPMTAVTESHSSAESIPPPPPPIDDCPGIFLEDWSSELGIPVKWMPSNFSDEPISSRPLCLDSNMQLQAKQCSKDAGWMPYNRTCNHTLESYDLADKCPHGYELVTDDICIELHSTEVFRSEMCRENLYPLTIFNLTNHELDALFTYLRRKSRDALFWLPAMHISKYNTSLRIGNSYSIDDIGLQWTLPAFNGERVVLHDNFPTCSYESDGGCLAFTPYLNGDNRFNTSIINCNGNFWHSFCLFRKNDTLRPLACPDGYVAPLMPIWDEIHCSAIHHFDPLPITEVSNTLLHETCPEEEAYQLNSVASTFNFELLAKHSNLSLSDRCLFGLTPQHVAVNSLFFVNSIYVRWPDFVNWDLSMGLREFNVNSTDILAANDRGKWLWESHCVTCIVCTKKVLYRRPVLELTYDSIRDRLTLSIINVNFLMPRFTNNLPFMCFALVNSQYTYNLKADLISTSWNELYDIQLIGTGQYWCHGHAIHSAVRIKTADVFARVTVMSMNAEFECRSGGCSNFDNLFRDFLYSCNWNGHLIINPAHIRLENVTNMIVVYPDDHNRFANILFHVSVHVLDEKALCNEKNELNLSDEMLTSYFIRQKFVQISNLQNQHMNFRIRSVNSTDFCLPSSISTLAEVNWLGARIGERVESVENCMDSNGRPLQRDCVGNALHGAQWVRLSSERECVREESSDLTDDLQYLVNNFEHPDQTEDIIERVRHLVADASDRFVRMDVYFVSKIVGRATSFLDERSFSMTELKHLFVIYNNVMQIDHKVARSSAAFNSTNVLLESLDLTLIHEANALFASRRSDLEEIQLVNVSITAESLAISDDPGIVISTSPMLINIVIDPMLTDVSGVAVLKRKGGFSFDSDSAGLGDYSVQKLYRNQSSNDLLSQPDLHVASFLPESVLVSILKMRPDAKLVFSIFYNDVLFQTVDNATYIKSDGKIIAVSVPGLKKLPGWLPIYVKPESSINDYCGYWDFSSTDGWSETGCFRAGQNPMTNVVMCSCDHLTHFAYLLKGNSSHFEEIHLRSLQGITVLGCTLSLIGIIGIYITAMQFRSWRSKTSTKYLLQLSTAIAFQMILLAFVNTAPTTQALLLTNNEAWCIVIGALLHYFVLAMFFWMLIIAYLQFIRYVIVFHHGKTPRLLLKSSLLGWSLPTIPVLLVIAIDRYTYVPDLEYSESQICYPSGYSLYFGILLPIGIIVGANLVIFILVNYNLLRGTNAVCKSGDRTTKLSQLRLSIFLFFLLGLTWIFGLLSTAFSETSIVFSYLFCLTSTLQGFVMFLYFVILDPVARNLWIYFFRRLCCSKKGMIDIRKENSSKDSY